MTSKKLLLFCALYYVTISHCKEITVCRKFDSSIDNEAASNQCSGQTIFATEIGPKGEKGDSGVAPQVLEKLGRDVADLQSALDEANQRIENMTSLFKSEIALLKSEIAALDGWYTASNGYAYRVTHALLNWNDARRNCQGLGGDLVVHGIQTENRTILLANLENVPQRFWIGLTDLQKEGEFRWVNGELSTGENTPWGSVEPNGQRKENCGEYVTIRSEVSDKAVNDLTCSLRQPSLCEKLDD